MTTGTGLLLGSDFIMGAVILKPAETGHRCSLRPDLRVQAAAADLILGAMFLVMPAGTAHGCSETAEPSSQLDPTSQSRSRAAAAMRSRPLKQRAAPFMSEDTSFPPLCRQNVRNTSSVSDPRLPVGDTGKSDRCLSFFQGAAHEKEKEGSHKQTHSPAHLSSGGDRTKAWKCATGVPHCTGKHASYIPTVSKQSPF